MWKGTQLQVSGCTHGSMELQHQGGHEQSPQEDQPGQGTADCSLERVRLYNNNILFCFIKTILFYAK